MTIPFNKPYLTGKEAIYIDQVLKSVKIGGDGAFTQKCHAFIEKQLGFHKALLTTSCTDALEMAAILLDIKEGDEVIAPSYTFVSTVNAFVLRGARIVFADSNAQNPNLDTDSLESLITSKTKVIIPVHYAGIACDMDAITRLAAKHGIPVVEDAAPAIHGYYKGIPLGSIGCLGAFSFHETKNIISGEGGCLLVNDSRFLSRAEIIREKGTNRSAFFRGEVDKYGWVDIGSSFLPSDITAAFLLAQLESIEQIQSKRTRLWETYRNGLEPLAQKGYFEIPFIPEYATPNSHAFYLVLHNMQQRSELMSYLKERGIQTVFHYLSLHKSPYYGSRYSGPELKNADRYSDCLLRLPMYYELEPAQIQTICEHIRSFFRA
jgi:dTDP-4-amino-4,6-dideoxygalactose transaminase